MIASSLGSAQDFIKTLKAHSDPPHADGPSKIELAREAWNNAAFYFPNKDETIIDWLLTRLLKDKAKVGEANPVIDSRYWQLLFDILCPPDEATGKWTDTRHAAKRWLLPLLNWIPLAPIVTAYFQLSSSVDERARVTLDELFSRCFASVWPLASPKFSPDTLLECFGALLARLATNWRGEDDHPKTDPHISQAALCIISSYRSAYGNLANKKKLYTSFLQNHFLHWLQCSQYGNLHGTAQCPLISEIYSAGTETLFSVDVLRNVDDHMCDAALKDALRKALSSSTNAVLRALPALFASFVLSLKRNRNALFSQSSNNAAGHSSTQVQVDGLAFYALCEENIIASPSPHVPLMWDTRIALLKTVDSESLYHASDTNGTVVLRDSGSLAIRVLTSSREDAVYVAKAVDVLAALTRIDYDLMAPNLPVIWPALARSSPSLSSMAYLRLLFDFHIKTRTVNVLVDSWLDAVSLHQWQASGIEPREAYATALGSPLFSLEILDRLGSAIRGFLTPGQLGEVTRVVVEKFRGAFEQYREQEKRAAAEDGDGPRKKRRKSTNDDTRVDPQWCAVEFALVSRIGVVVLGSLAIRTTSDDSRQELRGVVGVACASVIPRALKATLKALGADNRRGTWAWQIVATGALHMYHDRKSHGWPDVQLDEDVGTRLRALLGNDDILPEFSLMIARTLLNDSASDVTGAQRIIDDVLRCLEGLQSLDNTDELGWSGKSHELNDNNTQTIVAMLHLVLSRWLSLFDWGATSEQLAKLAKVIMNLSQESFAPLRVSRMLSQQLTPATILAVTLHSADVWELHRFRDAFSAQLHDATAPLANMDVQKLLESTKTSVSRQLQAGVMSSIAAFGILLHTPEDYLPRAMRLDFVRRALVVDVLIGTGAVKDKDVDPGSLLIVREFIRRVTSHSGNIDQLGVEGYFGYLLRPESLRPVDTTLGEEHDLNSVTLNLIGSYLASFLLRARNGEERLATKAVEDIKKYLDVPVEQRLSSSSLVGDGTLLRLVSTVASNYALTQLPQRLQVSLRGLYERMVAVYSTSLLRTPHMDESSVQVGLRDDGLNVLRMWSHTLWLGRWIQADMSTLPRFGALLLGQLLAGRQETPSAAICLALLDILKEEFYSATTGQRQTYIGLMVAGYVNCSRYCDYDGVDSLDASLSSISRAMPVEDYCHLLDHIVEAAGSRASFDTQGIASFVRLLKVVGLNSPEGTSKLTQQAFSKILVSCADRPNYVLNSATRAEVLALLNGYCSDRPASVRPSDMSTIWSILGQLLSSSLEHDQATDPTVFQEIVSIVSALVRLRRDLVLNTLPHLGMVLRRLINALKGPRPQLGAKQMRLVMNTLPAWISAEGPLSAGEARALARLMTTLTTKTIVRMHVQNAESQKPESLVRPFSKHAAYVLTAYIDAVNDPLCHVATQIRKELQPGLFALCDMLGDHNRDAMMVSALDASGKVMMKALWKEYEKQRYVGKG